MSEALEALNKLRNVSYDDYHSCMLEDTHRDSLNIIEEALIEKEAYQKNVKRYFQLLETRIANLILDSDEARELIQLEQELKGDSNS